MSKQTKKPVAAAIGAAFAGSMMMAGAASADANPFALSELAGGYAQVASAHEGKCGAGKCGGEKGAEGKCGAGKCGAGKCGGEKGAEGKCGAGKCGAGKCGGEKGAEGKCGAGKCGGSTN
jgi:uncharacterized low-complexity protein